MKGLIQQENVDNKQKADIGQSHKESTIVQCNKSIGSQVGPTMRGQMRQEGNLVQCTIFFRKDERRIYLPQQLLKCA
jgi:hypothetical protein